MNIAYEIIKQYINMIIGFLIIIISIMELDYNSVNLLIKKNIKLKLFLDILLFIILCYYFATSKSMFARIVYFVLIVTASSMITDTLCVLFNIKNKNMTMIYRVMIKTLMFLYLPVRIINGVLFELYNVQIEKDDLPYLNMPLILL